MTPTITVTGADERIAIDDLIRLSRLSERVEIGLLYTETPYGRNRYPGGEWLSEATERLGRRCAIHVCGDSTRSLVVSQPHGWIARAGRIQFNGRVTANEIIQAAAVYPVVITQHHKKSAGLLRVEASNHMVLVDGSGGRGRSPARWKRPETDKPVGFAGGLDPENLAEELVRIRSVARDPWWVDMEGKLRTEEDWFSLERAEKAIEVFLRSTEGW